MMLFQNISTSKKRKMKETVIVNAVATGESAGVCADCGERPCRNPKRSLDDCCACSGEVCGDCACPAIELVTCEVCCVGDREDELLLCDGCDHACHLSCMRPPCRAIPALWFCQRCIAAAVDKRRRLSSINGPAHSAPVRSQTLGLVSSMRGCGPTSASLHAAGDHVREGLDPQPVQRAGKLSDVDEELVRRLDQQKLKTCNCRKSRCLKQYCECFREKEFCSHRCNCLSCHNLPGKSPLPHHTLFPCMLPLRPV